MQGYWSDKGNSKVGKVIAKYNFLLEGDISSCWLVVKCVLQQEEKEYLHSQLEQEKAKVNTLGWHRDDGLFCMHSGCIKNRTLEEKLGTKDQQLAESEQQKYQQLAKIRKMEKELKEKDQHLESRQQELHRKEERVWETVTSKHLYLHMSSAFL